MGLKIRAKMASSFKLAVFEVFLAIFKRIRRLLPPELHFRLLLQLTVLLGIEFIEYRWIWSCEELEWKRV
jgi:hypothetical protein